MIYPNMATMLGFLTCDVGVEKEEWDKMISISVKKSFNAITVDSDTSTSDSLMLFATGQAENDKAASLDDPDNNGIDLGDTINYTIVVTNTGDLTLSNISVSDLLSDGNGTPISLSQSVSLTSGDPSSLNWYLQSHFLSVNEM